MIWIGICLIIIVVIFDALRDAWWNMTNFWQCHIPKWIAFFLPIIYILWDIKLQWYWIIVLAVGCNILWRFVANKAGMETAGSVWIRLYELIFKN